MDHEGPSRPSGKLESLPKDELLKFIKRQALASKDLKKKVADLEEALKKEKEEVNQLEVEKKEWISRGVSAEFEKKDKLVRKDRELELAARLAAEMLEENDGLRGQLQEHLKEQEDILMAKDNHINKLRQEKENLNSTLHHLQEEFEMTILESQELKEKLHCTEEGLEGLKTAYEENETLKEKVKDLEYQLSNPTKLNKLKEEYEGLGKENKALREAKMMAEQGRKTKSEQILNFDKDITHLRRDLAEKNKTIKEKKVAMDALKVTNEELVNSLKDSETKIQEFEADVQKCQVEKEKYLKVIKSMKTKFERSSLIEEELRKQLNTIVGERDELLKKNVKRSTQKMKTKDNSDSSKKGEMLEDLKNHISSLESENAELKEVIENHNRKTEEILTKYENLQKDFDNLTFELDELTAIKNDHFEEKERLSAGNESLLAEIQTVTKDFANTEKEKNDLTEVKNKLQEENLSLSTLIQNLNVDIESLSDEMKEILAEKNKLNIENEAIVNEKENLSITLVKTKEECEVLTEEQAKHKEEMFSFQEEFDKSKAENVIQLKQLVEEVEMFRKAAPEMKASILKLQNRVEELLNQLQTLNEEKLNQESALEELFKSHDDLSNQYDFECKEREKKEKEILHLEEHLNSLKTEEGKSTVDLEQQISMLEETINDLSLSRDHYQEELLVKEQCIQQLRHNVEDAHKRNINGSNQDVENYVYEIESIMNQLLSVTKELEVSNQENESLQTSMVTIVAERDESNKTLALVEENLVLVNTKYDVKELECEELKQQLMELSTPNNNQMDDSEHSKINNAQIDIEYLDKQYKQVSSENISLKEELQSLDEIKIKLDRCENEKAILSDRIMQYDELMVKYGYDNMYDLDNFIASLSSDLDNSAKQLQYLNVEKDLVDAKYSELNNQSVNTEDTRNIIEVLENEIVKLKEDYQVILNENNDLVNGKGGAINETNDLINQRDDEIRRMTIEICEKDEEINQKDCEINRIIIEVNEKEHELEKKDNEIDQLVSEISQKDDEINHLCNDIRQYQESINNADPISSIERENGILKTDIASQAEELMNLKQVLNDAHMEMVALKTSEENHSNEILEKQILIDELKAELLTLQESCKTQQERDDQSTRLQEKEDFIIQLSQDLKDAKIFNENLEIKLSQNNENLNEVKEKYDDLQKTGSLLHISNAQFEEKCSIYETQNAYITEDRDKVVEELNELTNQIEHITEDRDKVVGELNKLTVINVNVENKLQEALEKVLKLQNALEEKSVAMSEMDVLIKEKGDKGSKFKSVAIKAKKELEALRSKYHEESSVLEQKAITLKDRVIYLEKELVHQQTECSKHEEEFEEFEKEIKGLQTQLLAEQEMVHSIEEALKIKNDESIGLRGSLEILQESHKCKCDELEKIKPEMEDLQKRLDNALQEGHRMNSIKLEIVDYERAVDNLQCKLDTREKECEQLQETVTKMTDIQKNVEKEISSVKKEHMELESKNEKLKATIVKLKKDITDEEKHRQDASTHISSLDLIVENLKQTNEEMKIEIANLNADKLNLCSEMKNTAAHHEKMFQTLEVKFARVSSDLLTTQRENQSLTQEFEQYKIRAHNVLLKQRKSKQNEDEERSDNQQIVQLEGTIDKLKLNVKASHDNLCELESTYQELQTEHEGLQARHHEVIEEVCEKELAWKQKMTQVKLEASTKVLEYQDKLQLLQNENENLLIQCKEIQDQQSAESMYETMKDDKEKYEEEINRLLEEIARLKKPRLEILPSHLDLQKQDSVDSRNDSVEFKSVSERQEGEGMDSKELEIIDTLSQRGSIPHTPTSPSHASILERLLSPVEIPMLSSPQSPTATRDELALAKASLQTAFKKNDHMTALIRESEANTCRLADQAKVLKEEIRRLERNEERDQALSNMEYLKNVIIKFLKVGPVEKEQLIPVLSTMLKLSDEEKKIIFEYAKGDGDDTEDNGSWSSYVYRWTSLS